MSSKILRGPNIIVEPPPWQTVSSWQAEPGAPRTAYPEVHGQTARREHEVQEAYQRGLQEGAAAGERQAASRLDPVVQRFARTIEEISSARRNLRHEAEDDIVRLAIAVARRILYRELTIDPEALLGLIRSALDRLDAREVNRIRISAQDAPAVLPHFESLGLPNRVEIVTDPSLERGAAIFETSRGSLDASAETQLREIERGFADLVRRAQ